MGNSASAVGPVVIAERVEENNRGIPVVEATVIPKDLGTFAYLLAQKDRLENMINLITNDIKGKIKNPLINYLNNEYKELMNEEMNEEQIKMLEDKIMNYYSKNNLIKFNDSENHVLSTDLMNYYFTYIIGPLRVKYGIEGEFYPFEESRKNPEFCRLQDYYMNIDVRKKIEDNLTEVMRPYADSYREVIEVYKRANNALSNDFTNLDAQELDNFVTKIN